MPGHGFSMGCELSLNSWAFCLRSGIFPDSGGFTEFAVKIPPDQGEIIQLNT